MTIHWPPNMRVRPIVQWPGTLTRNRQRSNFSASFGSTIDLLWRELYQLSAANVVLQIAMSERDFRIDGYPRAQARAEHPGIIVTLDSKHGPLSYPCDRFTDWQDNLRAVALALEALRKVDRYGVTKRGEQYAGWKQLPGGTPMPAAMTRDEAAYVIARASNPNEREENLRSWCPRLITEPDMRAAEYRQAARRSHPDVGGTTEAFQRVEQAKRVLDGAA